MWLKMKGLYYDCDIALGLQAEQHVGLSLKFDYVMSFNPV
jgi:hypothetical protein